MIIRLCSPLFVVVATVVATKRAGIFEDEKKGTTALEKCVSLLARMEL